MGRRLALAVLALLGLLAAAVPMASAQSTAPGVVRAVMYWMDGCLHCHRVLDEVLPPIQRQYGALFELQLIEVVTRDDVDRLFAVGAAYGRPKDTIGVPLLLIGDQALMGAQEIPDRLPGLIEHYLALGGVDWPDPAGPGTVAEPAAATTVARAEAIPSGYGLAIAVLAGMVAALGGTAVGLVRGLRQTAVRQPGWLAFAVPVLAVTGLGVAGHLAYVEVQAAPAVCGPVGDCNAVQSGAYARLFGVLPVGVLGVAGYLAILMAWAWPRLSVHPAARFAPVVVFGLAVAGVLFSLYLTYLEPFVIGAVCLWCLGSAVLITLLLAASLPAALPVLAAWRQQQRSAGLGKRLDHAD